MTAINHWNRSGICLPLFKYWILLLIWQNLAGATNRGTVDTIVKLLLLTYLIIKFLKTPGSRGGVRSVFFLLFIFSQITTFILTDIRVFTPTVLINYLFPCIYIYLSFIRGKHTVVSEYELNAVNKYIRIIVLISIFYTLIFEPSQYTNAIFAANAYGNELHSFFASMYEYGLYLFYCITTTVREINIRERNHTGGRGKYYFLFAIYFVTLILTFCRTAIIGCLAYLLLYAYLYRNSKIGKRLMFMFALSVLIVLIVTPLRNYSFNIVWKGGLQNSRERLLAFAMDFYNNGTISQKIFGHGIITTRSVFSADAVYGSVHNGYVQVLLYYGIVGLSFLILYLITQTINIIRFLNIDRNMGAMGLAYLLFCILTMIPSTIIIFYSSIDCFFLTTMLIIIPMYERNSALEELE